ncbi:MAG: glycosyltransferase family 2 protein [Saprospiraceae bacterium]|nr:glycosyltransferase family 2 protein [Saprospiraceae bacterium]
MERSLKSAISQTYKNLEILVIGDCCTDDTEKCIGDLNDKRVKFLICRKDLIILSINMHDG